MVSIQNPQREIWTRGPWNCESVYKNCSNYNRRDENSPEDTSVFLFIAQLVSHPSNCIFLAAWRNLLKQSHVLNSINDLSPYILKESLSWEGIGSLSLSARQYQIFVCNNLHDVCRFNGISHFYRISFRSITLGFWASFQPFPPRLLFSLGLILHSRIQCCRNDSTKYRFKSSINIYCRTSSELCCWKYH